MTSLSPAAQAVVNQIAASDCIDRGEFYYRQVGAAALRAVADQVVPVMTTAEGARIYNSIEAIAAELEATS